VIDLADVTCEMTPRFLFVCLLSALAACSFDSSRLAELAAQQGAADAPQAPDTPDTSDVLVSIDTTDSRDAGLVDTGSGDSEPDAAISSDLVFAGDSAVPDVTADAPLLADVEHDTTASDAASPDRRDSDPSSLDLTFPDLRVSDVTAPDLSSPDLVSPPVACEPPGFARQWRGNFNIDGADDLEFLQDFTVITGNVSVRSGAPADIELPNLQFIDGHLELRDIDQVESVNLCNLLALGRLRVERAHGLMSLDLSSVTSSLDSLTVRDNDSLQLLDASGVFWVAGSTEITDNPLLAELRLTGLNQIGGDFHLGRGIGDVELPLLVSIGEDLTIEPGIGSVVMDSLNVVGHDLRILESGQPGSVESLSFARLVSIGHDLKVQHVDGFTTLSFPNLNTVAHHIDVHECDDLESLLAPRLVSVGGDLKIERNDELESLAFNVLSSLNNLTIRHNPQLCSELVEELVDDVEDFTRGSVNVSDNAACED